MENKLLKEFCEFALNHAALEILNRYYLTNNIISVNDENEIVEFSVYVVSDLIDSTYSYFLAYELDLKLEDFNEYWLLNDASDNFKLYYKHQPIDKKIRHLFSQHVTDYVYLDVVDKFQKLLNEKVTSRYSEEEEFTGFCD